MTLTTFSLSDKFLRNRHQRLQLFILGGALVFMVVYLFTPMYFSVLSLTFPLIWLVLGLMLLELVGYLFIPNSPTRSTEDTVILTRLNLIRCKRMSVQNLPYKHIKQVVIRENGAGKVHSLKIQGVRGSWSLVGFENMEGMAEELLAHLPPAAASKRQRLWLDTTTPYASAGVVLLGLLVLVWLLQIARGDVIQFSLWFNFGIGLSYLFFRQPELPAKKGTKLPLNLLLGGMYLFASLMYVVMNVADAGGAAAIWRNPCGLSGQVIQQSGCVRSVASEDSLYFAADNRTILWSDSQWDDPRRVYVTGYNSWLGVWTPTWSYDELDQLLVSADGHTAIVIAADRTIVDVWDVASRSRRQRLAIKTYGSHLIGESVQLSADGRYLADQGITIWDLTTGQPVRQIASDAAALAFSPDGQYLAGARATSDDITIWRISDGTIWQQLTPPPTEERSQKQLLFSPDGRWLLVGNELSSETAIEMAIWDLSTGERRYVWPVDQVDTRFQLAFSPDNQFVVGAIIEAYWDEEKMRWTDSDQTHLYVWRLADGALIKKQFLGFSYDYRPLSLDFAPDGSLLAVGLQEVGMVFRTEQLFGVFGISGG